MISVLFSGILLACVWCICDAQISSTARLQPHPLEAASVGQCCSFVAEVSGVSAGDAVALDLLRCVNESASVQSTFEGRGSSGQKEWKKKKVALLTYMSPETDVSLHFAVPDILEYGAYHAANTAVYAEHNDMMYRIATEEVGGNNEPADVRWNKVKLLMDALDPESDSNSAGWARDAEFIVWLDADAIVLDLGFSVEAIGEQFPHAHFIASADIRQGYINSGFLVLRNTPWLRTFLKDWWEISNRAEVCDQDAFDAVYTRYTVLEREARRSSGEEKKRLDDDKGRIEERVRILRRDALNSDPPATLRQHESNQVLHLMGESTRMRRDVFQSAFETTCRTLQAQASDYEYLPSQLGQSQSQLYRTALALYRRDTAVKLQELSGFLASVSFPPDRSGSDIGSGSGSGTDSGGGDDDEDDERMEASLALIARAPFLFEGLGKSAHHLCDLLDSPAADSHDEAAAGVDGSVECGSAQQGEMLATRRRLFDLCIRWLDATSAYLNAVNARVHAAAASSGGGGGLGGGDEAEKDRARRAVLKGRLSEGIVSFLHLLKRGAEAGNDLFGGLSRSCHFPSTGTGTAARGTLEKGDSGQGEDDKDEDEEVVERGARYGSKTQVEAETELRAALAWSRQKLIVSDKVFALLRELDARVSLESKHVPRHMRALMHQNVAHLHYTVAEHFLSASGDGDGGGDGGERRLRDYHLYQAEQHALSSVHIFDHTFGDVQEPGPDQDQDQGQGYGHNQADRATNEEHVLSLQILAAIYCTDGRNMTLGLGVWERTIAKARDNLQGVSLGKPLERLADIYHNAAVCHLHSSQHAQNQKQGHTQGQGQGQGQGARLLDRAATLAGRAVEARRKLQSARSVPTEAQAPAVPAHRPSTYLAADTPGLGQGAGAGTGTGTGTEGDGTLRLSLELQDTIQRKLAALPSSHGGEGDGDGGYVGATEGGGEEGALRYLSELDEEEWEECEAGEEGCEAFIMDGEEEEQEEELEEEQEEDVAAARRRYAAQTAFLSP